MFVYVEFIVRKPGVSLEEFQRGAGGAQTTWASSNKTDQMVLNLGRTWRIGREPEYLCAWLFPDRGLERFDEWEQLLGAGEDHADLQEQFDAVARIARAGCYRPLGSPTVGTRGHYYVEWFEVAPGASDDDLSAYFADRAARHGGLELNLATRPLGKLVPDGQGFAAWGLRSWRDAEPMAEAANQDVDAPIAIVDASLYADLGKEQL
jgi:hypothetical protein